LQCVQTGSIAFPAFGGNKVNIFFSIFMKRRFDTTGMVSDIIPLDDIVEKGIQRL
jgi:hypothetical protein